MLSFSLESLGCKVNNFEANASADLLIEAGYKIRDTFVLDDIHYMVYHNDINDDNVIVKE